MPTDKKKTDKKPAASATKKAAAKPAATAKPARAAKPATKAGGSRKAAVATISAAEVATRAYFIAEARHREGRPGNSEGDWIEAERQLRAEIAAAGKASA